MLKSEPKAAETLQSSPHLLFWVVVRVAARFQLASFLPGFSSLFEI